MAYNDVRSYIGTATLAAQNVVMTASGAIAPGTAVTGIFPVAEATFLCSIAGVVTATPASFPAGVRPYAVIGTTTSTGQIVTAPTGTFAQSSGSSAFATFIPPVALGAGSAFTLGLVAVGTASATQTLGATTLVPCVAPQYV